MNVYCYALAVFDSQLTLVGGLYPSRRMTNELWTSQSCTNWEMNLPAMSTKRFSSTAVSTRTPLCLVVAGGRGECLDSEFQTLSFMGSMGIGELSTVEVFKDHQWYSVQDLPAPCHNMNFTIHRGILYLMGGSEQDCAVFSCDLDLLLMYSQAIWKHFIPAPLSNTCPVVFGEHLVTVGGSEELSALIHGYFGCISAWKEIGKLPIKVFDTAAVVLPSGEMVVIGGFSLHSRSSKVYKSSLRGMLKCMCSSSSYCVVKPSKFTFISILFRRSALSYQGNAPVPE